MTRLMFPYIACMSFVALSGGVLNTWRQFKIPAFTPVLLNLSSIFGALFLVHYLAQPIYAMAIAVCVGGLLQVGIQIPALMKIGMLPRIGVQSARRACATPACGASSRRWGRPCSPSRPPRSAC